MYTLPSIHVVLHTRPGTYSSFQILVRLFMKAWVCLLAGLGRPRPIRSSVCLPVCVPLRLFVCASVCLCIFYSILGCVFPLQEIALRQSAPTFSVLCSPCPYSSLLFVCFVLLVACLSSQQHASVSQGRICTDNFTCCHTEIEAANQTFHLTQSQYTDTGPTSPSADPITPGAWQGSHWSDNF